MADAYHMHYNPSVPPNTGGTVSQQIFSSAARVGSRLFEEGNKLVSTSKLFGEGPRALRFLCFVGGISLLIVSVFPLLNVPSFFLSPPVYVLELYLLFFGFTCMVIESKDWSYLQRVQSFFREWFKFLTVPGGKGFFYLLIGSLAVSLWKSYFLYLFVGGYVCAMGLSCILVHLGMNRQLRGTGTGLLVEG